jgi:hypothetical protein
MARSYAAIAESGMLARSVGDSLIPRVQQLGQSPAVLPRVKAATASLAGLPRAPAIRCPIPLRVAPPLPSGTLASCQ